MVVPPRHPGSIATGEIKKWLNISPQQIYFEPVDATTQTDLQHHRLNLYTTEFQRLGFSILADQRMAAHHGIPLRNFTRLMHHPQEHAWVEIQQFYPTPGLQVPRAAQDMHCLIISRMVDTNYPSEALLPPLPDEEVPVAPAPLPDPHEVVAKTRDMMEGNPFWAVYTTDRPPDVVQFFYRRAQTPFACSPGSTPAELWRQHLEMRSRLMRQMPVRLIQDTSRESHARWSQWGNLVLREVLRRYPVLPRLIGARLRSRQRVWWGALSARR